MTKKKHFTRNRYTTEFKVNAVRLATMLGANIAQVARSLSISDGSLRVWIRQSREQESDDLTSNEKAELARLRKEVRRLREEKEILEKATVFLPRVADNY